MTITTQSSEKTVPSAPMQIDLRDWFAGQALAGMCATTGDLWNWEDDRVAAQKAASLCLILADAMIAARKGDAA